MTKYDISFSPIQYFKSLSKKDYHYSISEQHVNVEEVEILCVDVLETKFLEEKANISEDVILLFLKNTMSP